MSFSYIHYLVYQINSTIFYISGQDTIKPSFSDITNAQLAISIIERTYGIVHIQPENQDKDILSLVKNSPILLDSMKAATKLLKISLAFNEEMKTYNTFEVYKFISSQLTNEIATNFPEFIIYDVSELVHFLCNLNDDNTSYENKYSELSNHFNEYYNIDSFIHDKAQYQKGFINYGFTIKTNYTDNQIYDLNIFFITLISKYFKFLSNWNRNYNLSFNYVTTNTGNTAVKIQFES